MHRYIMFDNSKSVHDELINHRKEQSSYPANNNIIAYLYESWKSDVSFGVSLIVTHLLLIIVEIEQNEAEN